MKLRVLISLLMLSPLCSQAELFRLSDSVPREDHHFMQVQFGESLGENISVVIDHAAPTKSRVVMRMLGDFSEGTYSEIHSYYVVNLPAEVELALQSSGNLHNPALLPLAGRFAEALRSTALYREIVGTFEVRGYVNDSITFEKFTLGKGRQGPRWDVADIWLEFVKTPNKSSMDSPVKFD